MALFTKILDLFPNKIRKHFFWLIPLLAILALLLIVKGCSGDGLMGRKKSFLIGRESHWQIELLGRERSLTGFTNDLMAHIGEQNSIRFNWIETNPANLISGLDNKNYDFILTTLRPNVINQEKYDFSELIFELGPVLVVREEWQI